MGLIIAQSFLVRSASSSVACHCGVILAFRVAALRLFFFGICDLGLSPVLLGDARYGPVSAEFRAFAAQSTRLTSFAWVVLHSTVRHRSDSHLKGSVRFATPSGPSPRSPVVHSRIRLARRGFFLWVCPHFALPHSSTSLCYSHNQ